MVIQWSCPECDRPLRVKAELAGKKSRCPGCGSVITMPAAEGPESLPRRTANRAVGTKRGKVRSSGGNPLIEHLRPFWPVAVLPIAILLGLFAPMLGAGLGVIAAGFGLLLLGYGFLFGLIATAADDPRGIAGAIFSPFQRQLRMTDAERKRLRQVNAPYWRAMGRGILLLLCGGVATISCFELRSRIGRQAAPQLGDPLAAQPHPAPRWAAPQQAIVQNNGLGEPGPAVEPRQNLMPTPSPVTDTPSNPPAVEGHLPTPATPPVTPRTSRGERRRYGGGSDIPRPNQIVLLDSAGEMQPVRIAEQLGGERFSVNRMIRQDGKIRMEQPAIEVDLADLRVPMPQDIPVP